MEKCTYCVQRINAAKIEAEKENRRVRDGEVVTACQQACPTEAIVFGDMNDKTSKVAQLKAQPHHYALLEELQTLPRTTYLGAIRNPHPSLATAHKADTGHEG
jgi:Fe-S-cluster-containing dehydrogenase component